MKLKRVWLYIVITVLFITSFYVTNLRFDKFYRINGINNDNRVVLEQYLSKEDQSYLVENQIPLDMFYSYLKDEDFILKNYQYYDLLKQNTSLSNKKIVEVGNSLKERVTIDYAQGAYNHAKKIVENNLESAYLNDSRFDYDQIDYYILLKPLYGDKDYSFLQDTLVYIDTLENDGISKKEMINVLTDLTTDYQNKKTLKELMTYSLAEGQTRVYHPDEITKTLDANSYIGNYEPSNLIMLSNVRRVKYATYLKKDACDALEEMNEALLKDTKKQIIVYNGYMNNVSNDNYLREFQLGRSVDLAQIGVNHGRFDETESYNWLQKNSYKYGFVLRYPKNKASSTNNKYNANIYRYVGKDVAKKMYEKDLCLDEYNLESEE